MKMLREFRKGTNSGMPIIAIVAVIGSLAGMGVMFQVISGVGSQTGQDADRRQLTDLGSSIDNKCEDLSSNSDATSVTSIDVTVELKTDSTLKGIEVDGDESLITKLKLEFSGGTDATNYDLPSDNCDIMPSNFPLESGQHQVEVSGEANGDDEPIIRVEAD